MSDLQIVPQDLEILISECEQRIKELHKEKWQVALRLKKINKTIQEVKEEKSYFKTLMQAEDWQTTLNNTLPSARNSMVPELDYASWPTRPSTEDSFESLTLDSSACPHVASNPDTLPETHD